jgi:methyl-accepting chemotaxis protein
MKLRAKMMLGAGLIAAIPVIVASIIISMTASESSELALKETAKQKLISVRDITKGRIEDYFDFIQKQVITLSNDHMVIDAANEFSQSFGQFKNQDNTSISEANTALIKYYKTSFSQQYNLRNNGANPPVDNWLSQLDDDSIKLQHKLISDNPNPLGEKHNLIDFADNSDYGKYHQKYHPAFKQYLEEFGYYDIFIVDAKSGDIVYSVFKELDYTTSLKDGPFAQTGIGQTYRAALQLSSGASIIDFAPYGPSYEDPASFIGAPIKQNGQVIGVLIFQMPIDAINKIMTYEENWQGSGLGLSGESYLVAADHKSRTMSRFLIEDKAAYLTALKASGTSTSTLDKIEAKNTNIGLQVVETAGVKRALSGKTGFDIFPDYRNIPVLSAYSPVRIAGLDWVILTEIDESEAFAPAYELHSDITNIGFIVTIVLTGIGLVAGVLFSNHITGPIIKLTQLLKSVQSESDLRKRSDCTSKDEIGDANNSLNQMLEQFHQGMIEVSESTEQIATATEETSIISNQTQENISEQQISTELVATAINELTSTVQEVTRNIAQTADAAHKAYDETSTGDQIVKQAISGILAFAEQINDAAESIHQLEKDSENISSVVDVIKSIADQTNLLALNAAIEAARAGEQGRGFAVVADEVRNLAGKTQDSTEEINQMVERLQSSARSSVSLMNENKNQIQGVIEKAQQAGASLNNISNAVNEINEMSTQIATAAEEQVSVTEEINQNLVRIHT